MTHLPISVTTSIAYRRSGHQRMATSWSVRIRPTAIRVAVRDRVPTTAATFAPFSRGNRRSTRGQGRWGKTMDRSGPRMVPPQSSQNPARPHGALGSKATSGANSPRLTSRANAWQMALSPVWKFEVLKPPAAMVTKNPRATATGAAAAARGCTMIRRAIVLPGQYSSGSMGSIRSPR